MVTPQIHAVVSGVSRAPTVGPGGPSVIRVRVDGVEFGPFSQVLDPVQFIDAGTADFQSTPKQHYDLDDVLVGTTGYGSSDLFSDDFSVAGPVPPWDTENIGGSGAGSVLGGVLAVGFLGGYYYAEKDLGTTYPTIYVQFKVRFKSDVGVNDEQRVFSIWSDLYSTGITFGLFNKGFGVVPGNWEILDHSGSPIETIFQGAIIADDTFYTIDIALAP